MTIDNKFDLKQIVYLKTDKNQLPRIVVRIQIGPMGLLYCLNHSTVESWHYDFEMTEEKDLLMSFS